MSDLNLSDAAVWFSGGGMDVVPSEQLPRDRAMRVGYVLYAHPLVIAYVKHPRDFRARLAEQLDYLTDLAERRIDALVAGRPLPAWPS